MEKMSVTEYAKLRKISRAAVLKRLQPVYKEMPFIVKSEKVGTTWVLYVNKDKR